MNSSVDVGNKLRDDVYKILVAANKQGVTREKNVGGKNSDVFYVEKDAIPNKTKRIVAECKNYKSPLTRSIFDGIYSTYNPVRSEFDHLLIVSRNGLSPSVQQTLDTHDWITHLTFLEYCNTLLGFGRYVESVKAGFNAQGLSRYYIPLKSDSGDDIEEKISDWIAGEDKCPMAILAGYGMGKTSLARRIAYKYALQVDGSKLNRIPLYIELGGIFAEQDIEGLICKHCTARNSVEGFNYDLFLEFNRQGLLLIILDGFDEMKHSMSYQDFLYNFGQINSLVEGNSKIVVLGRPSAFMSENERLTVLHGHDELDGRKIVDASKKNYRELDVAFFDRNQVREFVKKYFDYKKSEGATIGENQLSEEFVNKRKKEILDAQFSELLSRPVHAHMLITIALSTLEPLSAFSRFSLYHQFVKLFLEREHQKPARNKSDLDDRRVFLRRVSWESWVVNEGKSISVKAISTLLDKSTNSSGSEGNLRELLVGSILEPKGDDTFYFVHRSFQEFLAAEHLLSNTWTDASLETLNRCVNPEILKFLSESQKVEEFCIKILGALATFRGALSLTFLEFLGTHGLGAASSSFAQIVDADDPWSVLVLTMRLDRSELTGDFHIFLNAFLRLQADNKQMAFLLGLFLLHKDVTDTETIDFPLARISLAVIHYKCSKWIGHVNKSAKAGKVIDNFNEREWANLLIDSVGAVWSKDELTALEVDLDQFGYSLLRQLAPVYVVSEPGKFQLPTNSISVARVVSDLMEIEGGNKNNRSSSLRKFWLSEPSAAKLVTAQESPVNSSRGKKSVLRLKG